MLIGFENFWKRLTTRSSVLRVFVKNVDEALERWPHCRKHHWFIAIEGSFTQEESEAIRQENINNPDSFIVRVVDLTALAREEAETMANCAAK
jgi:hypothetical protein